MSDDQGQQPDDASAEAPAALGSWLREAREAAGLGIESVAAALHLDPELVAALEAEAFESLGAPVFTKGHIRALASQLELDPAEAIRRYEATAGESGVRPPDLVVQYQRPIRRNRLGPALVVALIALLTIALVAVFLLWPKGKGERREPAVDVGTAGAAPPPTSVAQPVGPVPAVPASLPASTADDSGFAGRLAEARARTDAANDTGAPVAPTERPAAAVAGLMLSFTGECWFEVRDANGRRLATGTGAPGETRTLDGARPLAVTLGVADAVSMTLDGAPVDIPDGSRRGRSARLTLQ